jgi:hypothetical protein
VDAAVDLGNEPPLSVDGGTGGVIDRRRVSVQWFSGTILTGVCGAALMGGAVFASLDGETNSPPCLSGSRARCAAPSARSTTSCAQPQKRPLPPAGESNASRQVLPISNTTKVGDREVVRTRSLIRVSANLTMTSTEFAARRAALQRAKAAGGGRRRWRAGRRTAGRRARRRSLLCDARPRRILPRAKVASSLPIDDIIARVRDTANWTTGGSQNRYQVASLPAGGSAPLAYAADGTPDPYAGFETRIIPENITLLPKTGVQATGGNGWNERSVTVRKGDTIASHPQGDRGHARRNRGDRCGAGSARPPQWAEGRPETPHPGRRHGHRAAAADPRHRDGRQRDRRGGRPVRHGPIRLGRRRQHEHAGLRRQRRRRRG